MEHISSAGVATVRMYPKQCSMKAASHTGIGQVVVYELRLWQESADN
jgi:hypothetical protein